MSILLTQHSIYWFSGSELFQQKYCLLIYFFCIVPLSNSTFCNNLCTIIKNTLAEETALPSAILQSTCTCIPVLLSEPVCGRLCPLPHSKGTCTSLYIPLNCMYIVLPAKSLPLILRKVERLS